MGIGTKIRQIRHSKNIKQEELAYHLDMSQGTLSKIENEKLDISAVDLIKVADYTQTPINSLTSNSVQDGVENNENSTNSLPNSYSCIIVDDDLYAIERLEGFIDSYPNLNLIGSYTDSKKALVSILNADPVDLILLDIEMPQINGIALSKEIRNKTKKLVFTTAHIKYGYEAFQVYADDYLLKPFSLERFIISMNKIFSQKNG